MHAMTSIERAAERRFVGWLVAAVVALHLVGGALAFTLMLGCRCRG
jgi:hypothetical protein